MTPINYSSSDNIFHEENELKVNEKYVKTDSPGQQTLEQTGTSGISQSLSIHHSITPKINSSLDRLKDKVEKLRRELLNPSGKQPIEDLVAEIGAEMAHHPMSSLSDTKLDRFGTKHKNLILQARVAKTLEIPGIVVPIPSGIATETIEAFLTLRAPKVFDHWKILTDLYTQYVALTNSPQQPFLEAPEAADQLQAIKAEILKLFSEAANDREIYQSLALDDEVEQLLRKCVEQGDYLMVRSSGAEDTTQAANAGGNESKNYVVPERKSLCMAIGEVVASYFSYSSLQNRINVGINPFVEKLKIGLTTQELIGEVIGGEKNSSAIPISLVLFSNEPLYVGGEKFRVMRISATFGHGEGVVGGAEVISTDTYLVMQSEANPSKLYILSDIQEKKERLAPIQTNDGVKLQKIKNPPELVKKAALNDQMLARLFHWGCVGERALADDPAKGVPTDMEIVIKNGVIYPVQARSLIRPELLPTYLDLRKVNHLAQTQSPISITSRAEMLVPGNGSAVIVRQSEDILVADTLLEAERKFNKGTHKLVIVHTPEPANSHPVVNFSGLGIPCLYLADRTHLDQQMEAIDEDHPCVICMQNGTINSWNATITPPEACLSKGFTVHPAKIAISLPMVNPPQKLAKSTREVPQEVKDLLMEIRSATTHTIALNRLEALKSHQWVTQLGVISKTLKDRVVELKNIPTAILDYLATIDKLAVAIDSAFKELQGALNQPEGDRLRPLLHAKVLETLLMQPANTSALGLANYSIVDLEPLSEAIDTMILYQQKLSHQAHLSELLSVGRETLQLSYANEWESFLLDLEPIIESKQVSEEIVGQFKQFVFALRETGVLAPWMNLFFLQEKMNRDAKAALEGILKNYQDNAGALEQIRVLSDHISQIHYQLTTFENSATFETAWENLRQLSIKFTSLEMLNGAKSQYGKSSLLTNLVSYRAMENLVDLFDTSIKTMKASQQFSNKEKLMHFSTMLKGYNNLMSTWAWSFRANIPQKYLFDIDAYLDRITNILNFRSSRLQDADLSPSKGFSVTAAVLGSDAIFSRHLPETLEDVFTLIHQNLLFVISALNNNVMTDEVFKESLLPQKLKTAMDRISYQRIGFTIQSDGGMTVRYNVPLRLHSGTVELHYDNYAGTLSMKGSFLGQARVRWVHSKMFVEALDSVGILSLKEPVHLGEQEVSFIWDLSRKDSLGVALKNFDAMGAYSMLEGGHSHPSILLNPLEKLCQHLGLKDKLVNHYIKNPNPDATGIYYDFLMKSLPLETPQPIPLVAMAYSSVPCFPLYELIAEWAKTPDITCRDFITQYRSAGKLKAHDEPLISRFLPSENENGHALVLSRIILIMNADSSSRAAAFNDPCIKAYRKNAVNIHPLIRMIKEGLKDQDDYDRHWTELMVRIINQGKGLKEAESIIKKYSLLSEKTKGFLDAILKQNREQGITILYSQYQSHKKEGLDATPLMSQLIDLRAHLNEMNHDAARELAEARSQIKALAAPIVKMIVKLIELGLMHDEVLQYCKQFDYNDPYQFSKVEPFLKALYDYGKVVDVDALCKFMKLDYLLRASEKLSGGKQFEQTYNLLHYISEPELKASIDKQMEEFGYRVLLKREIRNDLMLQIATRAILLDDRYTLATAQDAFKEVLEQSDGAKIFANLILERVKQTYDNKDLFSDVFSRETPNEIYNEIAKELLKTPMINKFYLESLVAMLERGNLEAADVLKMIEIAHKTLDAATQSDWDSLIDTKTFSLLCNLTFNSKEGSALAERFVLTWLARYKRDERSGLIDLVKKILGANGKSDFGIQAIEVLNPSEENNVATELWISLRIVEKLVNEGKGYDLALTIIERALHSTDYMNRSVVLLAKLLDDKIGGDLAVKVLTRLTPEKGGYKVKPWGDNLLYERLLASMIRNQLPLSEDLIGFIQKVPHIEFGKALVARGELLNLAVEIAKANLPDLENASRDDGEVLTLVLDLVKKGYAFEMGVDLAKKCITHNAPNCKSLAFDIFLALSKQGHYQAEARTAAKMGQFDSLEEIRQKSYQILMI